MVAITEIRSGAAALFKQLGLRDFARVDGWLLPPSSGISLDSHGRGKSGKLIGQSDAGTVVFSDINLVCDDPQKIKFLTLVFFWVIWNSRRKKTKPHEAKRLLGID